MFEFQKISHSTRHIAMNPLQNTPPHLEHPNPAVVRLSAAVLQALFRPSLLLRCYGCFDVRNLFQMFAFYDHFVFGEEIEVAWCQIQ